MKFQIASDLHLEFPENRKLLKKNPLKPEGEILLLAGDIICSPLLHEADFFFKYVNSQFKMVLQVPGNHEFYHDMIDNAYPWAMNQIGDKYFKLNNQTKIIDNVRVIISTLWTHIPQDKEDYLYQVMNDYRHIYKKDKYNIPHSLTIQDTNYYHQLSLKFIENELRKEFQGKTIIMTHHLPAMECIQKKYPNKDRVIFAFATDLTDLIHKYPIDLWIYGHIHESVDFYIGSTRLICNPLGYCNEEQTKLFKNDLVIDL